MEEKKIPNEELVKDIERSTGMPSYWKKTVLDLIHRQKAEIERLTKRENELVEDKAHWINKWKEQVEYSAELQKQVDELNEKLDYFQKSSDYHEVNQKELEEKNDELQKQVDELKQKIKFEHELGDIKVAQALAAFKEWKKQAVKDTAKELARLVEFHSVATMENGVEYFTISSLGLSEILHEHFGVEYNELYPCNGAEVEGNEK